MNKKMSLLIVDDLDDNIFILKSLLKEHLPELELYATNRATEGLQIAGKTNIDCAILDVQMPEMDGVELCRRIKSDVKSCHTAVILLTAHRTSPELRARGLEAGADDFIHRPFENIEFIARVKVMLRTKRAEDQLRQSNFSLGKRVEEQMEALRKSEEQYRALYENAPLAYQSLDGGGQIIDVNPAWLQTLGYQRDEVIGQDFASFLHPELVKTFRKNFPVLQTCGRVEDVPFRIRHKQGHYLDISLNGRSGYHPDGSFRQSYCVFKDVTAQNRIQRELEISEERFRQVAENSHELIWEVDATGLYTYVNRSVENVFGLRAEELIGNKYFYDMFHPEDRDTLKAVILQCFHEKKPFLDFLNRNINTRGQTIWLETNAIPMLDDQGHLTGYRGADIDITERKKAQAYLEQALHEAEESRDRIEAILKSVADGLIFTDTHQRIVLMSASAEDLLGIKLADAFGNPIGTIINNRNFLNYHTDISSRVKHNEVLDFELPGPGSDSARIIQVKSSLVHLQKGDQSGVITLLRDISQERELDQMKNAFISTAAHELRTPLSALMGYSELLINPGVFSPQDQTEFATIIHEKSQVLEKIIDDLLNLSRVESGQLIEIKKEWCDLGPQLEKLIKQYQTNTKTHPFSITLPEEPIALMVDQNKITQVIENLLVNAVKFSPNGTPIDIKGKLTENQFQLSISDQGIGIGEDQIDKIFDEFYRVDSSMTAKQGLGLGMAIAKNIVESHGGKIWVDSILGQGTKVYFTLPLERELQLCRASS